METEGLHEQMLSCGFKETYGIDCLGCGMQRSVLALLEGDLASSIHFYPALIPMIFLGITVISHLIFKFKYGAEAIKYLFAVTAAITLINWAGKSLWPLM